MSPAPGRQHEGRTIELSIDLDASPADAYSAWADPDRISRWFVDRMEGTPKAGGVIWWVFEHFNLRHPISVVAAEPGVELVFGGELPGRPAYLQEFLFEARDGGTRFTLRNSGFGEGAQWDDEFAAVHSGWVLAMATMKQWLEGDRERPRTHVLQMRPAVFEFEAVQPYFTTTSGLAEWLSDGARLDEEPLREGVAVELPLTADLTLQGTVLARTEREVLLDWPARDAVLALKCFTMYGDQRATCLDLNLWSDGPEPRTVHEAWMTHALNRLVNRLTPS